jgi:hypothetical protein
MQMRPMRAAISYFTKEESRLAVAVQILQSLTTSLLAGCESMSVSVSLSVCASACMFVCVDVYVRVYVMVYLLLCVKRIAFEWQRHVSCA